MPNAAFTFHIQATNKAAESHLQVKVTWAAASVFVTATDRSPPEQMLTKHFWGGPAAELHIGMFGNKHLSHVFGCEH